MADKKINIDVVIDTANSAKSINDITKALTGLNEAKSEFAEGSAEFDKLNKKAEELSKTLKDVGSAGKNGSDGLANIAKGFNGIGVAIKASGIGLVIGLFAILKETLEKQQPVLDAIDTAFTAIGLAITAVSNALTSAFDATSKATGGFDATKKVIGGLLTLALTPFKIILQEIKAAVTAVQLIWEESFFGKGDPKRIKELKQELVDVKNNLVGIGKDAINAGKDVVTNLVEAAGEIGTLAANTVENISKIDAAAILAQAKRTTALKKQAKIAEAINEGIIAQYDRLAEKQRQIRDNDILSVADRIKANTELGRIIEEQQVKLLENARLKVAAAAADLAANATDEARVALIAAKNAVLTVQNDIEGKRSERIANQVALTHELDTISQTSIDGQVERSKTLRDANAELIKDEVTRLEQQKANLAIEGTEDLTRLQNKIDGAKIGTQARVDAENEYLAKKQDLAIKEKKINADIIDTKAAKDKEAREKSIAEKEKFHQAELKLQQDTFDSLQHLNDIFFLIKTNNLEKGSEAEQKAAKQQFQVAKALNLSMATITGIQSVMAAFANGMKNPVPLLGPATAGVYAGIAAIASAANIAKIASTKFAGTTSSTPSVSAPSSSTPSLPTTSSPAIQAMQGPSLKMIGRSEEQIAADANGTGKRTGTPIFKTYVVSSEVTSSQNAAAVIDRRSSF